MKLKFKLNETVHAIKSGKSGVVEATYIDSKGTHFDVRCGDTKARAHRYHEDQLESESAAKKRKAAAEKASKQAPGKNLVKVAKVIKAKAAKVVKKTKKPAKAK